MMDNRLVDMFLSVGLPSILTFVQSWRHCTYVHTFSSASSLRGPQHVFFPVGDRATRRIPAF
jgi:hypothetical protein